MTSGNAAQRCVLRALTFSVSALSCLILVLCATTIYAVEPAVPSTPSASESVLVTAHKLDVSTLIDRKVYTVSTDVQSTFGTVTDILGAIPSVEVDADGAVALRGDSNVLILIDGRRSAQLSGSTAAEALQAIPANDIERIEVMTTPPPQYKADGTAGVINIITRKHRATGQSGTVQASTGSAGRSVVGASASDTLGPLTLSGVASWRHDYRRRLLAAQSTAADPLTSQPQTSDTTLNELIHRAVPLLKFDASYAPTEGQTLNLTASRTGRSGEREYTQTNTLAAADGSTTGLFGRNSLGHDWQLSADEQVAYKRHLPGAGQTIEMTLHRSTSYVREFYNYTNTYTDPPSPTLYTNLGLNEDQVQTEASVDYVWPVSAAATLKAGYNFEKADNVLGNVGNTVDEHTGVQTADPNITNTFRYVQQIQALYGSYQAGYHDWNWLLGLRIEYTDSKAEQLTDRLTNRQHSITLYPSVHLDRRLNDETTVFLGLSRRVSRPDPESFNPYIDREYTPNLRTGNPALRPQDTRSIEVGYSVEAAHLSYAFTSYYRRNRDSVTDVTEYLGNGLSLSTRTNLPLNDSGGIELTANGRLFPSLAYSLSANLFHSQIDTTALGVNGLQSTGGLNAKLKLDYHLSADNTVQLSGTRSDKRLTPQGYVSAINLVNIGFKYQLWPTLNFVATVTDVLNGQRYLRVVNTPTLSQHYQRDVQGRIAYLGFVQSFGSSHKTKSANFEYDQ